jgi:long-chain acyl-CoA synthetase
VDTSAGIFDARVEHIQPLNHGLPRGTSASTPAHWAAIKLTSGSTGQPRGVATSADALLADEDALASTMGLRTDDRLLAAVPMSHSYGFTSLALACLVRGLQLVMPADEGPLAPIRAAEQGGATVFPTVPAYVQAVLRMSQPPAWPSGVRLFITAGAPLSPAIAAEFRQHSGRPLHVFYGSSECGGICFDRTGDAGERGTVGTPVDGVTISWSPLNPTNVTNLAQTTSGLLTVRSSAVGETYVPTPDTRLGDGRFVTADLAEWRDGEIALLRRADRVINVRGFKVDPDEVERVIAELTGVDEAIVTAAPGPDGTSTMVRAVVACQPGAVDAEAVTAWCRPRLAEHKVPRRIVIVRELPRTPRGKIDHAALEHA